MSAGSKWRPSVVTVIVVPIVVGLVGNLATNTVMVPWRWWPAVTWALVVGLAIVSVLVEQARARTSSAEASGGSGDRSITAGGDITGIASTGDGSINAQQR